MFITNSCCIKKMKPKLIDYITGNNVLPHTECPKVNIKNHTCKLQMLTISDYIQTLTASLNEAFENKDK